MNGVRVIAAFAAMLTALLLQAALSTPLVGAVAVSLPAVLIAVVALTDGPAAGMSFGFTLGLLADLGSRHPAGVLALSWLVLGVLAGKAGARRSVRADATVAAVLATLVTVGATALLVLVHADGATLGELLRGVVPTALGNGLIALVAVAAVRPFLRSDALRATQSAQGDLVVSGRRG